MNTARPTLTPTSQGARLRQARIAAGFESASDAASRHGWSVNTYKSNENGNAPYSFRKAKEYGRAFGVRPEWLYDGSSGASSNGMAPVVGRVGANPDGAVLFGTGQPGVESAPLPPGGAENAVALKVVGGSMRGLADDGSLIYFEDQRTPPAADMIGHVVVCETDAGEVLIKRLRQGSRSGRYDLESVEGETRRDVRLRWAAHVTAIVPPFQARRITTWEPI